MSEKVEVIAELKDLISGKFKEINAQIDAMDSKLSAVGSRGMGGGGIMGQVLGANLLTNAITRAGSAVIDFGKDSIMAYGRQEQFQTALTTLLYGNTQQAEALNNQLKQFALETPFELTEIQESTKQMIAYGSSAGTVVDEMRMLGDISAGVKKPIGELVYLYGTLRTQGRAYTRDINQFLSAGINLLPTLSKQMHFVQKDWKDLAEKGKISFDDVQRAFREMTGAGSQFGGMMEKQSLTLLGQASNLTDAWGQLQAAIGKSQQGILKDTVMWATQMVQQLNRIAQRSNFFDDATKNVRKDLSVNAGGGSQLFSAMGLYNEPDKQYSAFNRFNPKEFQYFNKKEEQEQFLSNNGRFMAGATRGTTEILGAFSDQLYNKIQDVTKAGHPEVTGNNLMNEMVKMRGEIVSELSLHKISSSLAVNQLAIIDKAMSDTKGLIGLANSKNEAKDKEGKTPKDLETLTKANKALQITVNIENLVRELTNNIGSSDEAKRMTTEGVAQALLKAVNDIYAVGQQ